MSKVGRPKEYRNVAEKQKAYRERKKASHETTEHAMWLLNLVEGQEQALRNLFHYWQLKGKNPVVSFREGVGRHAQMEINGSFTNTVNYITVLSMIRKGELVSVRRDWYGEYYRLKETT